MDDVRTIAEFVVSLGPIRDSDPNHEHQMNQAQDAIVKFAHFVAQAVVARGGVAAAAPAAAPAPDPAAAAAAAPAPAAAPELSAEERRARAAGVGAVAAVAAAGAAARADVAAQNAAKRAKALGELESWAAQRRAASAEMRSAAARLAESQSLAATRVQSLGRGVQARQRAARERLAKLKSLAAVRLQTLGRGVQARRRAATARGAHKTKRDWQRVAEGAKEAERTKRLQVVAPTLIRMKIGRIKEALRIKGLPDVAIQALQAQLKTLEESIAVAPAAAAVGAGKGGGGDSDDSGDEGDRDAAAAARAAAAAGAKVADERAGAAAMERAAAMEAKESEKRIREYMTYGKGYLTDAIEQAERRLTSLTLSKEPGANNRAREMAKALHDMKEARKRQQDKEGDMFDAPHGDGGGEEPLDVGELGKRRDDGPQNPGGKEKTNTKDFGEIYAF